MSARAVLSWGVAVALVVAPGRAAAQPGADAAPHAPPPTRATFVSTGWEQWDVTIDGEPACSTPCSLHLFPLHHVTLLSQQPNPVLLDVGRLPPGDLVVAGKPMQHGMYAGGIVATTFGGMAVAVGITLSAVGLAKDRDGMAIAGVITGTAGAVALAGGITLMVKAIPSVSVASAPAPTIGLGGRF